MYVFFFVALIDAAKKGHVCIPCTNADDSIFPARLSAPEMRLFVPASRTEGRFRVVRVSRSDVAFFSSHCGDGRSGRGRPRNREVVKNRDSSYSVVENCDSSKILGTVRSRLSCLLSSIEPTVIFQITGERFGFIHHHHHHCIFNYYA